MIQHILCYIMKHTIGFRGPERLRGREGLRGRRRRRGLRLGFMKRFKMTLKRTMKIYKIIRY